jgi:hypothetical protein
MIDVFDTPLDFDPVADVKDVREDGIWSDPWPDPWRYEVPDPYNRQSLLSPEEEKTLNKFFQEHPDLKAPAREPISPFEQGSQKFNPNEPWIQTYSGRRFNPTNPVVDAIVIQDIAHSLSMQCRFTGHVKRFYSIAQHSVLVSYLCDKDDRQWGLLHDADEAFIPDLSSPLKHSGKFDNYREYGKQLQIAICKRFGLPEKEPASVKLADTLLLATEARDLMSPLHPDWRQPVEPLPLKIDSWGPDEAEDRFIKRFYELWGHTGAYEHYLASKYG